MKVFTELGRPFAQLQDALLQQAWPLTSTVMDQNSLRLCKVKFCSAWEKTEVWESCQVQINAISFTLYADTKCKHIKISHRLCFPLTVWERFSVWSSLHWKSMNSTQGYGVTGGKVETVWVMVRFTLFNLKKKKNSPNFSLWYLNSWYLPIKRTNPVPVPKFWIR